MIDPKIPSHMGWFRACETSTSTTSYERSAAAASREALSARTMVRHAPSGTDGTPAGDDVFAVRLPPHAAREPRRGGDGAGTAVITRPKTQTKKPSMYRVLLLNDDYTPMEFVVAVLRKYFNKTADEATHIMLHVHHHGVGECGVFTYEVAETKVTQVMDFARKNQHPLQCIMEKK